MRESDGTHTKNIESDVGCEEDKCMGKSSPRNLPVVSLLLFYLIGYQLPLPSTILLL